MKHVNVLVFPCGSEVGLELNHALKDASFITLFGASSVEDHGKCVFENYVGGIPFVTAPDFIEKLNEVIVEKQIDYLYPAMDQVVDVLSEHRDALKAQLIAPEHDAVCTCRNKAQTYRRLAGLDFVPKVYASAEGVDAFPVIIKPEEGYGAKGFQILKTVDELKFALRQAKVPNVICEYLSGEEYTVDCFTNRNGVLQYVSCRSRSRIRNGISVNSRMQPHDDRIGEIARQISGRIHMRGAWFFQIKKDGQGSYKLLEVATRVAGTMCLNRAVGVNLPLLSVFDMMGYDVEITRQPYEVEVDRALYNAYSIQRKFREVYLDFDDTLIVHSRVNPNLMRFLYQCVNDRIPVRLITKHDVDIMADLKKYRINPELFDEIISIDRGQRKCDFVHPSRDALFIDDSFAERKQMQEETGMVCLGVDAVECLINYRQ